MLENYIHYICLNIILICRFCYSSQYMYSSDWSPVRSESILVTTIIFSIYSVSLLLTILDSTLCIRIKEVIHP